MPSRRTTLRQSALRGLLLAVTASLVSCIDSREECWLAADGSGRVALTCSLPASIAPIYGGVAGIREMIAGLLVSTPELTASSCKVVTADNLLRVEIHASFASAMDLLQVASGPSANRLPAAAAQLVGKIKLDVQGRTMDVTRIIAPGKAWPGYSLLATRQFDGHRLVYIMHLPSPATDSNATRVEDSGRTLVWDVPLSQALTSPLVTHFQTQIPLPWALVTALALLSVLVGGGVWLKLRKPRSLRDLPV